MGTKLQKIANAPHKKLNEWSKKLARTNPDKNIGKIIKIMGVSLTQVSRFLAWATKYAMLDNHLIRALEKEFESIKNIENKDGKENAIKKILKKHPTVVSVLLNWLIVGGIVVGGDKAINKHKYQDKESDKTEKTVEKKGTYGAYCDRLKQITPFLIADLIVKEGVKMENGKHVPYKDSRGKWTIGFGNTVLKNNQKVNANTPPITPEEAYELARYHLENGETYFFMYCYDVYFDKINIDTTGEALALGSIIYNAGTNLIENKTDTNAKERNTLLRQLFKEKGPDVTDSEVIYIFEKYPVKEMTDFGKAWIAGKSKNEVANTLGGFLREGRGLWWRRWIEAGLLLGKITPQMLMNCPENGMYDFFCYEGGKKSAFFKNGKVNLATYEDLEKWLANPTKNGQPIHRHKAKDYLPKDALAYCENNKCELENTKTYVFDMKDFIKADNLALGYDELYAKALDAFKQKKYEKAVSLYKNLIKLYPDDALLRNDLAMVYNSMGLYNEAIEQARDVVRRICDKSQYGAAQYNAGFAYEKLGNLEAALKNYKLALANGNRKVQADIDRIQKLINNRGNKKTKLAFVAGQKKIQKNASVCANGFNYKGRA